MIRSYDAGSVCRDIFDAVKLYAKQHAADEPDDGGKKGDNKFHNNNQFTVSPRFYLLLLFALKYAEMKQRSLRVENGGG